MCNFYLLYFVFCGTTIQTKSITLENVYGVFRLAGTLTKNISMPEVNMYCDSFSNGILWRL